MLVHLVDRMDLTRLYDCFVLSRVVFLLCHELADMLDNADPCIFDNDSTHIYYSYSVEHCNENPCNGQCVPRAFSCLRNEELQGSWICVRNERRAVITRDVAVCVELFAIHCHSVSKMMMMMMMTYYYLVLQLRRLVQTVGNQIHSTLQGLEKAFQILG